MPTLQPNIEFKHHILITHWRSPQLDNRLRFIILALAGFTFEEFGKPIKITSIFRTQETQDAIYWGNEKYKKSPWKSLHQFWQAADISVYYFLAEEQKGILNFLNNNIQYNEKQSHKTALIHNVGIGKHLHVQCGNDGYSKIIKLT